MIAGVVATRHDVNDIDCKTEFDRAVARTLKEYKLAGRLSCPWALADGIQINVLL